MGLTRGPRGGGDELARRRQEMVRVQLAARDIRDPSVLRAMASVERHRFVPRELLADAYADRPIPIANGQTISQPYVVASMTEAVRPARWMKVLEVGTGCGYQTAVLAELVGEVYTIEIVEALALSARRLLGELGYSRVHGRIGDGFQGWPEAAPFHAIVVTAAPPQIPPPLLDQLAVGGRLVIPVGEDWQDLVLAEKSEDGTIHRTSLFAVRFVPMIGRAQRPRLPGG